MQSMEPIDNDKYMPMVDEDYSEPSPPKCFKMRRRCCGRFYCTLWCFRRKTDRLNFAVLVIGVVGLALAFIIPALLNLLLKQAVTEGITLGSESASGYAGWQVADQPQSKDDPVIHYDLYLFDVVNANEVVCNGDGGPYERRSAGSQEPLPECPGASPELVERGPYAYNKLWRRFDVEWSSDGSQLSYEEQTYYAWDQARAGPGLSPQDVITQPSLAANVVKNLLQDFASGTAGTAGASSAAAGNRSKEDGNRRTTTAEEGTEGGSPAALLRAGVARAAAAVRAGKIPSDISSSAPFRSDSAANGEDEEEVSRYGSSGRGNRGSSKKDDVIRQRAEDGARAIENLGAAVIAAFEASNGQILATSDSSNSGSSSSSASTSPSEGSASSESDGGSEDSNVFGGDGWRLLLKLLMCAAPPAGDSPFHSRPMHDLYWGYWGDPLMSLLAAAISASGTPYQSYLPGFATNYTTEDDARRRSNGPTVIDTGTKDVSDIHNYVAYEGMSELWVCLAPDTTTGSESDQIVAVCPPFDQSWSQDEAEANGYVVPWLDPSKVPITGFNDASNFAPFHGPPVPGAPLPKGWQKEQRKVFISDIYRSLLLNHSSTYEWRDITLSRLQLRLDDLETANCSWAWPGDGKHCNEANAGYDSFGPSGLLNMSHLSGGAEIFASKPHFLDGHPWLVSQFKGALKPNAEIHDTYIDIEPLTGAPFRIAERLQINMVVGDWALPAAPLYDYYGWDPAVEHDKAAAGLQLAWVAVRKAAIAGAEAAISNALFGDDGICPTAAQKHFETCLDHVETIGKVILNATKEFCSHVQPTMPPSPLPSAAPSALPSMSPSSAAAAASTPATNSANDAASVLSADSSNGRRQAVLHGSSGGSTYEVCQAADAAYEQYLADGQVRQGLENLHEYCLDNDCEALEADARSAVKQLFEDNCWDANDDDENSIEGTVLCDAAKAVANGAASVLKGVATFCQGGPCELIAALEHIHQPPCVALANRRQKHVALNHSMCSQLDAFTTALIEEQCRPGRNWTNPTPVGPDPIFEESICKIVHEMVLENDFDDDAKPQWSNWEIDFHHGVFWKKADAYCSKNLKQKGECNVVAQKAQKEILAYCPNASFANGGNSAHHALDYDRRSSNGEGGTQMRAIFDGSISTSTLCAAAEFINQNWESIDGVLVKSEAAYRAVCNESASICDVKAIADVRANITSKALAFCNATSFNLSAAFADDDKNGNDDNDDAVKNHHHWARLAAQCPNLIAKAQSAVTSYCDHSAPFECAVVSSIPWGEVPFDDDGGPVLSFLVDSVVPKIHNLTAALREKCLGPSSNGNNSNNDGDSVPAWREEACANLNALVVDELSFAFKAAVEALDELLPAFNLSSVVASAGDWLTCSLGESQWNDFPTNGAPGYFVPLSWANEWMDLPESFTDGFTDEVVSVQLVGASAYFWCLVLAVVCILMAALSVLARHLTRADYQDEERLLNRELVARKDQPSLFAGTGLVPEHALHLSGGLLDYQDLGHNDQFMAQAMFDLDSNPDLDYDASAGHNNSSSGGGGASGSGGGSNAVEESSGASNGSGGGGGFFSFGKKKKNVSFGRQNDPKSSAWV